MTANIKDEAAQKPAAKKTARKRAAKKTARKSRDPKNPGASTEGYFPPEVLADLAVKLVRLKTDVPTGRSKSALQLASPGLDATFADALKRAEMLLLSASGKSDEDIHAYQLFTEQDGLMSFEEIAERFKEFEWGGMHSGNTVKPYIEELVTSAEFEVQKEREKFERLLTVRHRHPGGLYSVVDRVRRYIRNMIGRTGLRDLFDDPYQAADVMGQLFFRLMENKIPGDWERTLDEEHATALGFESFIEFVCGGLTYERFIGDPPNVWMNLERLGCFVFCLETLSAEYPARPQIAEEELRSLMRLVRGRADVPREAMSDLDACLVELGKPDPDAARVKELASSACRSLHLMRDRWYLRQLASVSGFSRLIREVRGRSKERKQGYKISVAKTQEILELLRPAENADNGTEGFMDADRLRKKLDDARRILDVRDLNAASKLPVAKIRHILKLLRRAEKAGRASGESIDVGQLRQLLDEVLKGLGAPDLITAAQVPGRFCDGTIADEMKQVATGLKKGLQMKPPSKRHARQSLNDLLRDLKPYSGERKCRPYELFLFAAQKRLRDDKLVRKRSDLETGFIPNPPDRSSLSILESHRGAEIAMGIE